MTNNLRVLLCLALALPPPAGRAIELAVGSAPRLVVPVNSLKQIRFATTVRQQYDFSCGSAALATLLSNQYGVPMTEQVAFEQMFSTGDQQKIRQQGFSLLDMQRFLASRGFHADGFNLSLEALAAAKLPAIVLVSEKGYNHFVVIKGINDGRVLLGDPSSGTRAMPLTRFRDIWPSKLLFVIHGYEGAVAFNRPADWRAAPAAPLSEGVARNGLDIISLPKFGPGDF